ncbi:ribokinase [Vulcaniibacterium tengchongense]|uniref:Ribokinase n=1 Tax=Vulcaniibacterium tengchongense TaxID=1273429 RepID=A0A3N4VV53_9GAMM|nr:ribokinase [Vulcaniibacterium tengchongense]RPE80927.1 ribokinase [Vulcaniibacterium tengchongense]
MGRVVVVGSFNVDHVWRVAELPRPGETLSGEYRTGPGGKGFNQATAAARAGAATAFVCALGEDAGGQLARALATADGIDLRDLPGRAPTGTAGIYVGGDGRNSIVIGPGANAELSPAFVEGQGDAVAAAGAVLAQLESPVAAVETAFRLARAAGATTLLNPAPADALAPASLLALADIVTPNESEFAAQLRRHAGEAVAAEALGQLDDDALHAHCRRLLPHGTVVVTLGAQGCFVSHAGVCLRGDAHARYRVPAAPVRAVDTTGAGDAFNGALAASLALRPHAAFVEHVRYANRYAGLSTERPGAAAAMPRDAEVRARFGG